MLRFRLALIFGLLAVPVSRADDGVDSDMYRDPELPTARIVKAFPAGMAELWFKSLDRPEADLQSSAAQSIALAHQQGLQGLSAAIPALLRVLDRADQHPGVRTAAARALVALDARDAAPLLLRHTEAGDPDLREFVDPALARWDYQPARTVWLDRLNQPPPYRRSHALAMQMLATVREEKAVPRLRELMVSDDVPLPYRLEAARALAVIRPSGGEVDAAQLASNATPGGLSGRLVAASLLRHHQGDEAVKLLQALGRDPEPAVAAAALTRLAEIDTGLILPLLEPVLASSDGKVRLFAVEAMTRHPTEEHVRRLSERLVDAHPEVRAQARRGLRELAARPELRELVLERGMQVLTANDWRGQEQATLLLGRLDHKPAAARLVELLQSSRPEVFVTAAWGLRVLAVPETLPAALAHLEMRYRQIRAAELKSIPPDPLDRQLSQLVQFLGRADYRQAEPILRQVFPRGGAVAPAPTGGLVLTEPPTPVGGEVRAAAIWALGLWYAGKSPPDLATAFEQRLTGDPGLGPDDERVRRMAAVSLGRIKAESELPSLRLVSGDGKPTTDVVAVASRWAISQITGEPLPPPGEVESVQRHWFLVPVR
jgi:HEAT repeat protein